MDTEKKLSNQASERMGTSSSFGRWWGKERQGCVQGERACGHLVPLIQEDRKRIEAAELNNRNQSQKEYMH